jgi:hypothetical protein
VKQIARNKAIQISLALLLLTVTLHYSSSVVLADISYADQDLLVFEDHFLDLAYTDTTQTTATVDTVPPGYVTVKNKGAKPFSLHPLKKEIAVVAQKDLKVYAFTGNSMQGLDSQELPELEIVTYSSAGNFLAAFAQGNLHIFGFTEEGTLQEITTVSTPNLVSMSGFFNDSLLLLFPDKITCLAWNGEEWTEYPNAEITGLTQPTALDFVPENGELSILDGAQLKLFRWDGECLKNVESSPLAGCGIASGVGGVRLLGQAGSAFYATDQGTPVAYPALNDPIPALAISRSSWGAHDYALLTHEGIRYRAFTGEDFATVPEYSIDGQFGAEEGGAGGVGGEGIFVSTILSAKILCSRVRIEAEQVVPPEASVKYEVSTDGGITFSEVPLDTNTPVLPGYDVVYRITLKAGGSPPLVDRIKLLQIGLRTIPAALLTEDGKSRVRLVQ